MKFKPKCLFLAVCAGDRGVIRELADAGLMPTFKSLLEKGLSGRTRGVETLYVQCNWFGLLHRHPSRQARRSFLGTDAAGHV
jgi:hypothetical protein